METLSPAQPLSQNHQTAGAMPPEIPHHTSVAGSKPDFMYKSLLNQHTQKLKKPPPIYQTLNEGPEHQPRFRSTVWLDGVSYTSSNTFHQRKASEMDVSKLAYIADKTFCKSIIAEFVAKKSLEKPVYETTQLEAVPAFRSNLVFNGRTYLGESAKSKKEAEQSVARSVVIQYLGIMRNCKTYFMCFYLM
ncbi:double-stranded RNA-binding protein 4-like [Bidens hawaiensis]|uniref:double-stranded RNA-binding protein 4-like n=1 Tax=Bidens hawaiensis TaxID=980011 RepID=UPI00404B3966